jgi:hypothetical protein
MIQNNKSPMRKLLAKRTINYYDELKKEEAGLSRSKSRRNNRSGSPEPRNSASRSPGQADSKEKARLLRQYDDVDHKKLKLEKTKSLMKSELERAELDGALDHKEDNLSKSKSGYPTFYNSAIMNSSFEENNRKKAVGELLREKVIEAEQLPDYTEEVEELDDSFADGKLFHIDVKNVAKFNNSPEGHKFDYHQRKSKEIRRIQYVAQLDKKRVKKVTRRPAPQPEPESSEEEVEVVPLVDLQPANKDRNDENTNDADQQEHEYEEEPEIPEHVPLRSDPKERFNIWTVIDRNSIPSYISSPDGFLINEEDEKIEIKEGDEVLLEPKEKYKFKPTKGVVHKPEERDGDCDFVVIDSKKRRYPIQVTERRIKRPLDSSNCTLYDSKGNLIGRAQVDLTDKDPKTGRPIEYCKGVLLDSDNDVSLCLVKRVTPENLLLKNGDGEVRKETVVNEEDYTLDEETTVTCLTLEKKNPDKKGFPDMVFLFNKRSKIENHPLFENELSKAVCEDGNDYEGPLKVQEDPEENQLWMNNNPREGKKAEFINIDLDEKTDAREISELIRKIEELARRRKKKRSNLDGIDFTILDQKGRRLKVSIRNEDDDEPLDSSVENYEDVVDPESIYYRVEFDGKTMTPTDIKKKGGSSPSPKKRTSDSKEIQEKKTPKREIKTQKPARQEEIEEKPPAKVTSQGSKPDGAKKSIKSTKAPSRPAPEETNRREERPREGSSSPARDEEPRYVGRRVPQEEAKGRSDRTPNRDLDARTRPDRESSKRTVKYEKETQQKSTPSKKPAQKPAATQNSNSGKRQNSGQAKVRIQMDMGDEGTLDFEGYGETEANRRPVQPFDGPRSPANYSNRIRDIQQRAARAIQTYYRYHQNKAKLRSNKRKEFEAIKRKLNNNRLMYSGFVTYYLNLPKHTDLDHALKSYANMLDKIIK